MAGSVNKVILIGNLGRDPEIRSTQDGMRVATLAVATSESWRDKMSGERKERTEWHRVVIFNERLAEIAEKYLKKGSKVYLEGALQTRKWTDNSGQERYTAEDDLGRIALLTRIVGPFAGLQGALEIDLGALLQIFLGDLGEPFVENDDAMPFGALLALARHLVAPAFRGGDRQRGDAHSVLGRADFRIAAEIADQDHLVDAASHGVTAIL